MALVGDRFIFVHNPHTGGTSIRSQLKGIEIGHPHIRNKDIPKIEGRKTFGICRNPYDWFVSRYDYIKRTPDHYDLGKCETVDSYLDHYEYQMKLEKFLNHSDYYCTQFDYLNGCRTVIKYEEPLKNSIIFLITGTMLNDSIVLNKTESKTILTDSQRERIRLIFQQDFYAYGY